MTQSLPGTSNSAMRRHVQILFAGRGFQSGDLGNAELAYVNLEESVDSTSSTANLNSFPCTSSLADTGETVKQFQRNLTQHKDNIQIEEKDVGIDGFVD